MMVPTGKLTVDYTIREGRRDIPFTVDVDYRIRVEDDGVLKLYLHSTSHE
ncbi:MAG: hypothetical protein HYW23_01080 [Candidatus Aenigmarchaeota archaeon]|nr:hypothetical protein [Candidatus Aenigmarchaeota archaeon]